MAEVTSEPPFRVGDRVRMKPDARHLRPQRKRFAGVVLKVTMYQPAAYPGMAAWAVRIRLDGAAPKSSTKIYLFESSRTEWQWEREPVSEMALDHVCQTLARAVLDGHDMTAALALADRVYELCGATGGRATAVDVADAIRGGTK